MNKKGLVTYTFQPIKTNTTDRSDLKKNDYAFVSFLLPHGTSELKYRWVLILGSTRGAASLSGYGTLRDGVSRWCNLWSWRLRPVKYFLHTSSLLSNRVGMLDFSMASEHGTSGYIVLRALLWTTSTLSDRYPGRLVCQTGHAYSITRRITHKYTRNRSFWLTPALFSWYKTYNLLLALVNVRF